MDYQELMEKLEPNEIENKVTAPIEKADLQARYQVEQKFPQRIEDFQGTKERIVLYTAILYERYGLRLPEEYILSKALEALRVVNLASVHDQVQGTQTGLNEFFEKIKRHLINQQVNAYITFIFEQINAFDAEEIEALCTEYFRRFGRYLPFELRSIPALMLNWRQVFQNHAQIMSKIKKDVGAI